MPLHFSAQKAYHFNLTFLGIQYALLAVVVILALVVAYTLAFSPRDYLKVDLVGNRTSLVLVMITLIGYVLTLVAKEITAVATLDVLQVSAGGMDA